ncbi:MAG: hypothetical protein ABJ275_02115 [Maricaulaceae bacterium]
MLTVSSSSPTSAFILAAGLVLSTVSEAFIRVAENSWIVERWTRGTLHKENIKRNPLPSAIAWILFGIVFVLLLPDFTTLPEKFELTRNPNNQKIPDMFLSWYNTFKSHPGMIKYIILCWVARTVIYRRSHNTVTWHETTQHVKDIIRNSNHGDDNGK